MPMVIPLEEQPMAKIQAVRALSELSQLIEKSSRLYVFDMGVDREMMERSDYSGGLTGFVTITLKVQVQE